MKRKSYAKLNLCLDIISRRSDGYHNLEMVMVPIDVFDTISIKRSPRTRMKTNKGYLPLDNRNSVIHAINILRDRYHFSDNFDIRLIKNTPTRGGLGGGSSNGALTLRMVNELLNLEIPEKELFELSQLLGTDVPFTFFGKPAYVSGIGDQVKEIPVNLDFYIFIIKPKRGVSTPELFKKIQHEHLKSFKVKPVLRALEQGNYELLVKSIGNALEEPAAELVPDIKLAINDLLAFGFDAAMMSGAGSSVFGITQDEELVNKAVKKFYRKYDFVKKTKIIKDVRACELIE